MGRHTKGPWKLDDDGWVVSASGDFAICLIDTSRDTKDFDPVDLANAHLIAAAPALLEAVKLHVAYEAMPQDRGGKNGPKGRAWAAFIAARDAALSSAEVQP